MFLELSLTSSVYHPNVHDSLDAHLEAASGLTCTFCLYICLQLSLLFWRIMTPSLLPSKSQIPTPSSNLKSCGRVLWEM